MKKREKYVIKEVISGQYFVFFIGGISMNQKKMRHSAVWDRVVVIVIFLVLAGVAYYYHNESKQAYVTTNTVQTEQEKNRVFDESRTYYIDSGAYLIKDKNDVVPFERALAHNDKATVDSMLEHEKVYHTEDVTPAHFSNAHLVEGHSFAYIENGPYIGKQAFVLTSAIKDKR